MNLNILAYCIYFAAMAFIIGRVGWLFYFYGQVYIDRLFENEWAFGRWLNKLLLKAYYLFNLGYVAISIRNWIAIEDMPALIGKLASEIGRIVLLLAIMHYVNLIWLNLYSQTQQRKTQKINIKNRNHGNE